MSGRTKIWSIDLTILHLDEFTIAADNFEEVMTAENTGKTIVISSVGLHAKQGTNGIYLLIQKDLLFSYIVLVIQVISMKLKYIN